MEPLVFALPTDTEFAENVANEANVPLAKLKVHDFEDGEFKIRSLENVRNRHCFIIGSLYHEEKASINDKLVKMLFFIGSLRDAAAGKITAVAPYTAFARQDRKTTPQDPLSLKYLAHLFEAVGTDRFIGMDVHNIQAFQNAFNIPTSHLFARQRFVEYFRSEFAGETVSVMSPDIGGIKRARAVQEQLQEETAREIPLVFLEKKRSGGKVSGKHLVGKVKNRHVLIYDDMISSGTTLVRAAEAAKEHGAKRVIAAATHAVFSKSANQKLDTPALDHILVTNTIPPKNIENPTLKKKLQIVDATPLFSEAIKGIVAGETWE